MKILLASYGAAHVRMIMPLLPLLKEAGYEVEFLALTAAAPVAQSLGIEHKRITDFVDANDPAIQHAATPLIAKHHNPNVGISEAESIAYLGGSMKALSEAVGEEEAQARYAAIGLNAFDALGLAEQILDKSKPDIVIATCSPRLESALLRAAHGRGVLSVCIVAIFPLIGMEYLKRADNGTFIVVGNARFKEQLTAQGRPEDSIIIGGNPAFDLLVVADKEKRRADLRKKRGIRDDQTVVLWAEQPDLDPAWPVKVREAVVRACAGKDHLVPLIRLHPASQDPAREQLPAGVQLSWREEDATDALLTADILVTGTSTIGYEAALMDKEVIVVRGSAYDFCADYADRDGAHVIADVSGLEAAIEALAHDSLLKKHMAACRAALPKPGHFARDMVALIDRLSSARNHKHIA